MEAGSSVTSAVCCGAAHRGRAWGTSGQGVMPLKTYIYIYITICKFHL